MHTLSVEAIKDFQVCELYYELKHENEYHEVIYGRDLMAQRFENTLKKVASFFFYKKQASMVPSYNAILNRWEKLWFPKDMTAYDLAVEQHEISHGNIASYSNVAAAALERFHDDFSDDSSDPILIDESFLIPMGDELRLDGRIDLVLRKGDEYKVIKWSARQKKPGINSLILDFAAIRLAFEHRNESPKKVEYCLYDLASASMGFIKLDQPRRADMNALIYWAQSIRDNEVFVPRRGYTAYCRGCPFDAPCAEWDNWPKAL